MIIKNKAELATTEIRSVALEIIEAGISRVLPSVIMPAAVSYDRNHRVLIVNGDIYHVSGGRIFVIGGGKASGLMAENLENILGTETITDGLVACKDNAYNTGRIRIIRSSHPVPGQNGVEAVRQMLHLKEQYSIDGNDTVLCLISGGGSALMPYPAEGISLQDKQAVTRLLLASGADINEINAVRKHLSGVKGGRLGYYLAPARVLSLILSDVIGNDLSTIASGPTFPDSSTFADAYGILGKYKLLADTPDSVVELLEQGRRGLLEETPEVLNNCHNYIIGDNTLALQAMAGKARELGRRPFIITAEQKGDTAAAARLTAEQIIQGENKADDVFLLGGETTLKVPESPGVGGRNQHYAAVSLLAMREYPGEWAVVSIGTDGSDYLPDVAGAIVDNNSLEAAVKRNMDVQRYIENCDSNTLLRMTGNSLIATGNTGTNVCDVIVYVLDR